MRIGMGSIYITPNERKRERERKTATTICKYINVWLDSHASCALHTMHVQSSLICRFSVHVGHFARWQLHCLDISAADLSQLAVHYIFFSYPTRAQYVLTGHQRNIFYMHHVTHMRRPFIIIRCTHFEEPESKSIPNSLFWLPCNHNSPMVFCGECVKHVKLVAKP